MNLICPVCGTENLLSRTKLEREEYTECGKCGLIYSVIRMDYIEKQNLYRNFDEGKYYNYVTQSSEISRNFRLFWQFMAILDRLIDRKNFNGKCFEIGSSAGWLLKKALESHIFTEVKGFEFCKKIAEHANASGINTTHCDFELIGEDMAEGEMFERFDVGFASHVIEHFTNPIQSFINIKNLLRPGGLFITLHPDIDVFPGVLFHVRKEVDEGEHLNMFGEKQLLFLLKMIGGLELVYRHVEEPGQSINVIKKI